MYLLPLSLLAAFAATTLLFAVLWGRVAEGRRTKRAVLAAAEFELASAEIATRELAQSILRRLVFPGLKSVGALALKLTPTSVVEKIRRELTFAGNPAGWDAERVLAMKLIAGVGLGLASLGLIALSSNTTFRAPVVFAAATVAGYWLPSFLLRLRYRKRQDEITQILPDTLDLLSITVEAGLGFDSALARVAQQTGGPLAQELTRAIQEIQLGTSRAQALRNIGERTTSSDLKSFVLAMVQADVFGISIAKVLQVQANEMRMKRRQRAEERAQKIPVKIVFPLILCIFPALFVVMVGPAAIRIYEALFSAF
jgi:tight adherence protein C